MFNNILVVCVGNICRSPIAEYLLKAKLADKPVMNISSSGLGALEDHSIDPTAGTLLLERDIDATEHRARQLHTSHLVKADLVLTMDSSMVRSIGNMAPQVSGKTFLLGKWDGGAPVADPYRKSREAFEHVYGQIDQFTDSWLPYLIDK